MLDRRRELVQVMGSVTLDEDDHPKKITDVLDIIDVDISAFHLS